MKITIFHKMGDMLLIMVFFCGYIYEAREFNKGYDMKPTINKTSKLTPVNGSTGVAHGVMVKRITKVEFGYVVDIVRTVVVRSYECATLEEAKRCE